jgi:SOS-response transcriptional repressor LexA
MGFFYLHVSFVFAYNTNKCSYFAEVVTMALSDIERKVLRIIGNYSAMKPRPPSVDEICVKTGRSREDVMTVLEELTREKYIEWKRSEPDNIEVITSWERKGR